MCLAPVPVITKQTSMTSRFRIVLLLILGSILISCKTTKTPNKTEKATVAKATEPIEFIILQLNDVYEIAPLEGGKYGGLARVATLKKNLLKENPNTIAVLSGDFLSPSFIGTLKMEDGDRIAGLQMVETLNAMGMDYVTFGNHEFDLSDVDVLKKRINQSEFKYVSANALLRENGITKPFSQNGKPVPAYAIHEIENNRGESFKLGIIGVVLPFNKQNYVAYLPVTETFKQTYGAMQRVVDVSVALTHLAAEEDVALAKTVPGMPLFLGGHDHTNMSFYVENTIITKADANAKTVYVHRGKYDPCSGEVSIRSSLVTVDDRFKEDPKTKVIVDKWLASVDDIAKNMGFNPARQVLLAERTLVCTEAKVRTEPTNYGRLTNAVFEAAWPEADVYLLNSGSMRLDDDLNGVVTEYDILRTFPFGGNIVRMQLSGVDLARLLEIGLVTNRGDGGYLQSLHVEQQDGTFMIGEEELDPAREYSVVMPKFLAEGREANLEFLSELSFENPETFTAEDGTTIANDIRNIMIYYLQQLKRY